MLGGLCLRVELRSLLSELLGFLLHSLLEGFFFGEVLGGRILPNIFTDLHGAKVWAAHGAEVG